MGEGKEITYAEASSAVEEGFYRLLEQLYERLPTVRIKYKGRSFEMEGCDRYGGSIIIYGGEERLAVSPLSVSFREFEQEQYFMIDVTGDDAPFVSPLLISRASSDISDCISNQAIRGFHNCRVRLDKELQERCGVLPEVDVDFASGVGYFTFWYGDAFNPDIEQIEQIESVIKSVLGIDFPVRNFYEFCEGEKGLEFEVTIQNGRTNIP